MEQHSIDKDEEVRKLTEIVRNLRKRRQDLIIQLHSLKKIMCVPRPLSFKEYEAIVPNATVKTTLDTVATINLVTTLNVYYLCGIKFSDANVSFMRVDLAVACGPEYHEGFFVEIKKVQDTFSVESAYMPDAINMKEVTDHIPMCTYDDIAVFLQYLHRCVYAYFQRRKQINELQSYCASHGIDMDLFSSHHKKYIEFNICTDNVINSHSKTNVTFILQYNIDSIIPIRGSFNEKHHGNDVAALNNCLSIFLNRPLKEAMKSIISIRKVKSEEQLSESKSSKQISLKEKVHTPSFQSPDHQSREHGFTRTEYREGSSAINDISDIVPSGVGFVKQNKKNRKLEPIASSTPSANPSRNVPRKINSKIEKVRSCVPGTSTPKGTKYEQKHIINYMECLEIGKKRKSSGNTQLLEKEKTSEVNLHEISSIEGYQQSLSPRVVVQDVLDKNPKHQEKKHQDTPPVRPSKITRGRKRSERQSTLTGVVQFKK